MYRILLIAHSDWRWAVLVSGFAAILTAAMSLAGRWPWTSRTAGLGRLFSIAVDIQVLMGAALYLVASPLTTIVVTKATVRLPSNSQAYFFAIRHPIIMIIAFIGVHVSSVLVRRGRSDTARQRRSVIFYGLTLLIILAGIPWGFRPLGRV